MSVMTVSHWTSACVRACNLHLPVALPLGQKSTMKPVLWANRLNLGLVCLSIQIDKCITLYVVYECACVWEFKAIQEGSGSISLWFQRLRVVAVAVIMAAFVFLCPCVFYCTHTHSGIYVCQPMWKLGYCTSLWIVLPVGVNVGRWIAGT